MLWLLSIALGGICTDFSDDFSPASWVAARTAGSASVNVGASSNSQMVFNYGRGTFFGVSSTTFTYTATVPDAGVVSFDWTYTYDHGDWDIDSELFVDSSSGTDTLHQAFGNNGSLSGSYSVSGSHSVVVAAGTPLSVRVRGENGDIFSGIGGTVTLTNLSYDAAICACDGVWYGSAYEDPCGTCDDEPANDCGPDCLGVLGGPALEDNCGTCDANPTNDCTQDCLGDWGGFATEDLCGTCDANPANDCVQDCLGLPGGPATYDMCGSCDADPLNDCTQDCAGTWGGPATLDNCFTCDDDPLNDCAFDCLGVPGGPATTDMCGSCDIDPLNDCTQDCNGDWGGAAFFDACAACVGGNTGLEPCGSEDTGDSTPTGDTGNTGDTGTPTETSVPPDSADTGTSANDTSPPGTDPTTEDLVFEPGAVAMDGCGCVASATPQRSWWAILARR